MILRTLQKVRMRGGKGKDWKLICLPMESFPSFSTSLFVSKSPSIASYHDYVSLRRILPQYCIQNGNATANIPCPCWNPPHGLRCVISRKSSGSGCTKPREPRQTNQWERSWWVYSFLLSPFRFLPILHHHCTFHFRFRVYQTFFVHHWLTACHSTQVW